MSEGQKAQAEPTWLEMINMEMENMDENSMLEPTEEIQDTDRRLGPADPRIRKYMALSMAWIRDDLRVAVEASFVHETEQEIEARKDYHARMKTETSALQEIFWTSVRRQYNYWDEEIGIRRGWVVVIPEEKGKGPSSLMEAIMGGGAARGITIKRK